jgi:hypothetical protein
MTAAYRHRYGPKRDPFLTRTLDVEASYDEVAAAMGISVARVGQLECTGLQRLRRCFEMIAAGVPIDTAVEACRGRIGRPRKDRADNAWRAARGAP